MAFETNKEAAEWKAAIEAQIRYVAETRRPMLPDSVDAKTISAILDLGQSGCAWKRVAVYEGVCVLEHITFEKRSQGRYKYHPLMNMQVCLLVFLSVYAKLRCFPCSWHVDHLERRSAFVLHNSLIKLILLHFAHVFFVSAGPESLLSVLAAPGHGPRIHESVH